MLEDPFVAIMSKANKLDFHSDGKIKWERLVKIPPQFKFDIAKYEELPRDAPVDEKLRNIGFNFVFQEQFLQKSTKKYKAHVEELCTLYHLSLGAWLVLEEKTTENMLLMIQGLLKAIELNENEFSQGVLLFGVWRVFESSRELVDAQLFGVFENFCGNELHRRELILSGLWKYLEIVAAQNDVPLKESLDCIVKLVDDDLNVVFLFDILRTITRTRLLYNTTCTKFICNIIAKHRPGHFGAEFVSVCDSIFDPEIHQFQQIKWPEGSEDVIELPVVGSKSMDTTECFFDEFCDRDLKFERIQTLDDLDYWNLYVPRDIQTLVDILTEPKTAAHYHMELLSAMLNGLKSRADSPYFTVFACILVGTCYLLSFSETEGVSLFLLTSPVFDQRITFFDKGHNDLGYQVLNAIRNAGIECVARCGFVGLHKVAELFGRHPVMLSEILQRFISVPDYLVAMFRDVSSASVLKSLLLYYLDLKAEKPEFEETSWSVISLILTIVFAMLDDSNGREILLSSSCFHPLFYSIFYLRPLRKMLIEKTRAVLQDLPFSVVVNLKVFLSTMIERLSQKPLDNETTRLIVDVLMLLSVGSQADEYASLSTSFTSVFEIIMMLLSRLKQGEMSKQIFFAAIECMSVLGATSFFTNDMVGNMEVCILELFGTDPVDERLYVEMLQLLKGKIETPVTPNFAVSNGETLKLLVDVFVDSSQLSERFIQFFAALLQFKINVEKCREHDIDILILKKIAKLKESDQASHTELITSLLGLFRSIANIHSSTRTVKQYLALLTPIRDGVISIHQQLFLSELNRIVLDAYYLGFVAESKWIFTTNEEMLTKGFAITFWLRPLISTVHDLATISWDGTTIDISMKEEEVYITVSDHSQVHRQDRIMKLEVEMWNLVVLSFTMSHEATKVLPQVGSNVFAPFDLPRLEVSDVLKVAVVSDKLQCDIGSCRLRNLMDAQEIENIVYENPVNSELSRRDHVLSGIAPEGKNFMNLLINAWKMEVALPIFSLWNCQFEDRTFLLHFPRQTVDLFTRILLYSVSVQEYFVEKELFDIISGILTFNRYDETIVNYRLYGDFHSMFVVLTSEKCKRSLFSAILVNPSIWVVATPEDRLKIVRHWSRVLFPSFCSVACEERPFDFMLDFAFIYFPYVNLPLMLDRRYGSKSCSNVEQIRNELHQLLLWLAAKGFTRANFYNIFYQCMGFTDVKHSQFCMFLLNSLVSAYPAVLTSSDITAVDIMSLAHLFKSKSADIVQNVIEVIANLESTTRILDGESLTTYFHMILWSLASDTTRGPSEFNEESSRMPVLVSAAVYSRLLKLMLLSVPELVTICGWYAVNVGEDAITELVSFMPDYHERRDEDNVLLWLEVAAIITTNNNSRNMILKYLARCPNWTAILWTIRVLCGLFDVDESICFAFLKNLNETGVINNDEMVLHMLIVMTWWFKRDELFANDCLVREFLDSPFCEEEHKMVRRTSCETDTKALYSALATMDMSLVFSLRLDSDSRWKHKALAEELLQIQGLDSSLVTVLTQLVKISCKSESPSEISLHQIPDIIKQPVELLKVISELQRNFSRLTGVLCPKLSKDKWDDSGIPYSIPAFQEKNAVKSMLNEKKWSSLWSSLIIENGPWDSGGDHLTHWQRDRTQCFAYCPVKLKRNNRFDIHEDASRARDLGTVVANQEEELPLASPHNFFDSDCMIDIVDAIVVKPAKEEHSRFRVCIDRIEIITDQKKYITIEMNSIRGLHKRTWNHQETALEIFTATGPSYFIHFPKSRIPVSHVISKIASNCPKANYVTVFNGSFRNNMNVHPGKTAWTEGRMSNFEYLMLLNVMSGRTFNDIAQYPVFPWTLKTFDNEILDLDDESIFRDLGCPLGAMNESRFNGLMFNYEEMRAEGEPGYLYSSGPISPLTVALLLLRMEPFTTAHIQLQGNRFDASDRMFSSLAGTFKILVSDVNEYWELPPEFYFCPEVLENLNGFDLGETNGAVIGDVKLPPWAQNALEFIYFHRKVLESDHVSSNIHKWIDLIWGKNQRDINARNLYHPYLYESVWDDIDVIPEVVEPYLRMVGQIPPQLFIESHAPKTLIHPVSAPSFSLSLRGIPKCGVCCKSLVSSTVMLYFIFGDCLYSMSFGIDGANVYIIRPVMKSLRLSASLSDVRSIRGAIIGRNGDCLFYFAPEKDSFTQTLISTQGVIVTDAASGEWVSTSTDDFVTTIFSTKKMDSVVGQFRSYRGSVVCSAISDIYKIHVMGTSDGILVLTSLKSMEQFRVIDLEDRKPLIIEITPAWGFILVCGSRTENGRVVHYLMVYTINGKKVREAPLMSSAPISKYTVFASDRGFDYLAYVSRTKLFVCEVFFLNQEQIPDRFIFSSIEWLEYHRGIHSFLAIDDKATLLVIPFIPDDFKGLRDEMSARREQHT